MFVRMEKLIELLNEYEWQDTWSYDEEMGMPYYWWGDDCDYEAYLISKKYWFIEWLVENNKIYENKIPDKFEGYYYETREYVFDKASILLMELSIQDEPINFLISLLK